MASGSCGTRGGRYARAGGVGAQPNTLCAFSEPGAHMRSVPALG